MIEFFIFITGLAMGSFFNVVIYRLPKKESILFSRSHCTKCGAKIKFYDNIPVLSYLILRGKCRNCKYPFSIRYLIVELLTAFLFVGAYYFTNNLENFIISIYLISIMVIISFIDIDERIIPDIITLPGIIIGLYSSLLRNDFTIIDSVLGLLVGGGVLFLIAFFGSKVFKKEAMGGGDIKLVALLGTFLGYKNILLLILLSSFIGAIGGIIGLIFAKDKEKARIIPFGPYIAISSLIIFWWGNDILKWYLGLFIHP